MKLLRAVRGDSSLTREQLWSSSITDLLVRRSAVASALLAIVLQLQNLTSLRSQAPSTGLSSGNESSSDAYISSFQTFNWNEAKCDAIKLGCLYQQLPELERSEMRCYQARMPISAAPRTGTKLNATHSSSDAYISSF